MEWRKLDAREGGTKSFWIYRGEDELKHGKVGARREYVAVLKEKNAPMP